MEVRSRRHQTEPEKQLQARQTGLQRKPENKENKPSHSVNTGPGPMLQPRDSSLEKGGAEQDKVPALPEPSDQERLT